MSIYASWAEIGEDESGIDGTVLQYQRSHVFPHIDHPAAALGIASIPEWCVPGIDSDELNDSVARFIRLDVREQGEMVTSTVVLTEPAVVKLHAQLTDWLAHEKRDPIRGRAE